MTKRFLSFALAFILLSAVPAAAQETGVLFSANPTPDKVYPLVTPYEDGVEVVAKWPSVVTLSRMGVKDKPLDQSSLTYTADVQGVNITGKAYLEMWLHFPDKGFFYSRGFDNPIDRDGGWKPLSTPFFLKKGEQPDEIILNIRMDGSGTLRIRNVKLAYLRGEPVKIQQKQPEAKKEEKKD